MLGSKRSFELVGNIFTQWCNQKFVTGGGLFSLIKNAKCRVILGGLGGMPTEKILENYT